MIGKKAQGTTEYLIILSVIIVIALVVVGVMGWFPGLGTTITEQQSKAFWQAASPIAITGWDLSGGALGSTNLVLRNQTTNEITVTDITLATGGAAGVTIYDSAAIPPETPPGPLAAGSQTTTSGTNVLCSGTGPYSYKVVIKYNEKGGLTGAIQTGTKPLVGNCS